MKFLLDMGISPSVGGWLKATGHQAKHLADENLDRLSDPEILEKARAEDRVLLTHDLDFADLLAAGGESLPSVVILRLRNMKAKHQISSIDHVVERYAETLRTGVIITVSEGLVRSRVLPL